MARRSPGRLLEAPGNRWSERDGRTRQNPAYRPAPISNARVAARGATASGRRSSGPWLSSPPRFSLRRTPSDGSRRGRPHKAQRLVLRLRFVHLVSFLGSCNLRPGRIVPCHFDLGRACGARGVTSVSGPLREKQQRRRRHPPRRSRKTATDGRKYFRRWVCAGQQSLPDVSPALCEAERRAIYAEVRGSRHGP